MLYMAVTYNMFIYVHTMLLITLLSIILLSVSLGRGDLESRSKVERVRQPAIAKVVKMRCTRRFSPGVCVEEVVPVWTFVFMAQNCTERLGCPINYRTNRFRSYRMCMRRCRALVNMYLKMVEHEESNGTYIHDYNEDDSDSETKSEGDDFNLREGLAGEYYLSSSGGKKHLSLNMDSEDESYKEGEQEAQFIVYKDGNVNEDIEIPDVDYVPGEIKSEFDLLRW